MAISSIDSVTASVPVRGYTTRPRVPNALDALARSGTLQAIDSGRTGVDRIKAALTRLRDALQTARSSASVVPGGTQLTPIVAQVGTRALVVGYEAGSRPSLAVQDAVGALASSASQLVATVGGGATRVFTSDVSALLESHDLKIAMNAPDVVSIDAALGQIDGVLAKADGLRGMLSSQASATAQTDIGGALLGASGKL